MAVSFDYSEFYFPPAPVAEVTIRAKSEVTAIALLDSGADGSIIPYELLSTIGAKLVRTHRMTGITGASTMVDLLYGPSSNRRFYPAWCQSRRVTDGR